jgi:hypothetical protein
MNTALETYKIYVDILKGYLDTALTANIWFYAITGAIVANYLSHGKNKPILRFSLSIPAILGVALAFVSFIGRSYAWDTQVKVREVAAILQINGAPPVDILWWFLSITGALSFIVGLCLGVFVFWRPNSLFIAGKRRNR